MGSFLAMHSEVEETLMEVAGERIIVTNNTGYSYLVWCTTEFSRHHRNPVCSDERLEYVTSLIRSGFEYVSLAGFIPQYLIIRKDLLAPKNWSQIQTELNDGLILRESIIPRGFFTRETIIEILNKFRKYKLLPEERGKFDVDKMYWLVLFIFDYVYLTLKETTLNRYIKKFITTSITIDGTSYNSTALIDEMLEEYIARPFDFVKQEDGSFLRCFRDGHLYVKNFDDSASHPHFSATVMTAMFYDLFKKFFQWMGLKKRKGASLSDSEKILIDDLLKACHICEVADWHTSYAMYLKNKNYFKKCELGKSIRSGYYSHLMLNNQSKELFGDLVYREEN